MKKLEDKVLKWWGKVRRMGPKGRKNGNGGDQRRHTKRGESMKKLGTENSGDWQRKQKKVQETRELA